jgi:hypothetical protein
VYITDNTQWILVSGYRSFLHSRYSWVVYMDRSSSQFVKAVFRFFSGSPLVVSCRMLSYYTGCKKSPPPLLNFFINKDKLIIFRDWLYSQKKKFLVYANFYPLPPKRGSLGVSWYFKCSLNPYQKTHPFKRLNKIRRVAQTRGLYDDPRKS